MQIGGASGTTTTGGGRGTLLAVFYGDAPGKVVDSREQVDVCTGRMGLGKA